MNRFLRLLVLLLSLQISAKAYCESISEESAIKVSLNKGKPTNDDTHPRTLIPFTCVYADGIVQLILLGEVGEYTLTVSNQTSGECWSAENILLLQTSTASGTYQVEIEVEDGTVYYGTYTL